MKLDPTYEYGSSGHYNGGVGEDPLDAICRSRTIQRQGRDAALWLRKMGLIRDKTQAEVQQDLEELGKQAEPKVGRPSMEDSAYIEEDTLEAFEIYKQGGRTIRDIASDYGITESALRYRFHKRGLKKAA